MSTSRLQTCSYKRIMVNIWDIISNMPQHFGWHISIHQPQKLFLIACSILMWFSKAERSCKNEVFSHTASRTFQRRIWSSGHPEDCTRMRRAFIWFFEATKKHSPKLLQEWSIMWPRAVSSGPPGFVSRNTLSTKSKGSSTVPDECGLWGHHYPKAHQMRQLFLSGSSGSRAKVEAWSSTSRSALKL